MFEMIPLIMRLGHPSLSVRFLTYMNHHSPRVRKKHHNIVDALKKTGMQLRFVVNITQLHRLK